MQKTTLIIMAAGIGSRFGQGIKQLTPVGPAGEIIMDYSIHDALEAGFDKVVFIIRKDLEKEFKEIIGNRIEKIAEVAYAYQELENLPEGFEVPEGRTKPWGTGQALLSCKGIVKEPFIVINADDYYGKEGFRTIHAYLTDGHTGEEGKMDLCMAGFILGNTLSENGAVTRGICQVDQEGNLIGVDETSNIVKTADGAGIQEDGSIRPVDAKSHVSMNMWGMQPEFMDVLEGGFREFLANIKPGDIKAEYLLPMVVDKLIKADKASVAVLESRDKWFGVTYQEDRQSVVHAFEKLVEDGVYSTKLFNEKGV